jgi:aerobic-type carbon monoxide dehydrogenase small subunit (CoxS/CutS family)
MVVLNVNGVERRLELAADETLLAVLRDRLELTGTKYGCGEGQCGACTVIIDGRAVKACRTAAAGVAGKKIITIEGLTRDGTLHPVQQAFLEAEAFQCGYCTPGMIMAAAAFLAATPHPSEEASISAMNGNLCRCGTYPRIVHAIQLAAKSQMQSA